MVNKSKNAHLCNLYCCFYICFIIVLCFLSLLFFNKNQHHFWAWHTPYKIIVFESDDWGVKGMSKESLKKIAVNFEVEEFLVPLTYSENGNLKWLRSSLESEEDLERLYKVLEKHKDSRGRKPIFTANIVVANPDFKAIKENNFQEYKVIAPEQILVKKWKEGLKRGIFYPQYHGYSHFNYENWMKNLKNKEVLTMKAFDLGISRITAIVNNGHELSYTGEYLDLSKKPSVTIPFEKQKENMRKGLDIFKKTFGYNSISTIAPFYMWDDNTEKGWNSFYIKYIQGGGRQVISINEKGENVIKRHLLGEKNNFGQIYLNRNCSFEIFGRKKNIKQDLLKEIDYIFSKGWPAIIDTHMGNYVSGVDPDMRDFDLIELDSLLQQIEEKFPDVIYLTSVELGELVETGEFYDFITGKKVKLLSNFFNRYKWILKEKEFYLLMLITLIVNCLFILVSKKN